MQKEWPQKLSQEANTRLARYDHKVSFDVYRDVAYPIGVKNYVQPIVDMTEQLFGAVRRFSKPSTQFFVENLSRPGVYHGGYSEDDHTVDLFLPFFREKYFQMPGIATKIRNICERNPKANDEYIHAIPRQIREFTSEAKYGWTLFLKDWMNGSNFHKGWELPQKYRRQAVDNIATWMDTYVFPDGYEIQKYVGVLMHEYHHGEMYARALNGGFIDSNPVENSSNMLFELKDCVPNPVPEYLVDYTEWLSTFDGISAYRIKNKSMFEYLRLFSSEEQLRSALEYLIYAGASEYLASHITNVFMKSIKSKTNQMNNFYYYSEFQHMLPERSVLEDWRHRLTCQPSQVGERLGEIYEELFDEGQFVDIVDQVFQKEWVHG